MLSYRNRIPPIWCSCTALAICGARKMSGSLGGCPTFTSTLPSSLLPKRSYFLCTTSMPFSAAGGVDGGGTERTGGGGGTAAGSRIGLSSSLESLDVSWSLWTTTKEPAFSLEAVEKEDELPEGRSDFRSSLKRGAGSSTAVSRAVRLCWSSRRRIRSISSVWANRASGLRSSTVSNLVRICRLMPVGCFFLLLRFLGAFFGFSSTPSFFSAASFSSLLATSLPLSSSITDVNLERVLLKSPQGRPYRRFCLYELGAVPCEQY